MGLRGEGSISVNHLFIKSIRGSSIYNLTNSLRLPRTNFRLGGIGQDPGVLLRLLHGHLLMASVGFAHYVVALLAHHNVTVLAAPFQPAFHFKSIGQLEQGRRNSLKQAMAFSSYRWDPDSRAG